MQCCGRRQMLGVTGVVASGLILGGCGGDAEVDEVAEEAGDTAATAAEGAGDAVASLVAAADVPVGGGTVVETAQVVVTQPTEGDFKAFSAVCPHQGCLVSDVRDGAIVCPCHGSRFDVASGAVLTGPATSGLEAKRVSVDADGISVS